MQDILSHTHTPPARRALALPCLLASEPALWSPCPQRCQPLGPSWARRDPFAEGLAVVPWLSQPPGPRA